MSEEETSRPGFDGVNLLEEIRLLVDMVIERSGPWIESVIASGHHGIHRCTNGSSQSQSNEDEKSSAWCPLCIVVSLVRGERPEFLIVLLEQAAQLIALLRAVLADRWNPEAGIHMPGFRPSSKPATSPAASGKKSTQRVHRIPVHRRDQWSQSGEQDKQRDGSR